jgi:hypothetical protein
MLVVVAGCGGEDASSSSTADPTSTTAEIVSDDTRPTTGRDPSLAQSCAELADTFVETHQHVLDVMGGEVFEGDMPPEVESAVGEALEFVAQLGIVEELCAGGFTEFDRLRCERSESLETHGLDWETYLNQVFPPCTSDSEG